PGIDNIFLNPDERYIIGSDDEEVKVWQTGSRKLIYTLPNYSIGKYDNCFTPESEKLLTHNSKIASLWNLQTGTHLLDFANDEEVLNNASFSHNGKTIMVTGEAKVSLWDTAGYLQK